MVRYTKASSSSDSTSQLRDRFLRDLTSEAQGLMKQLSQQFGEDLQSQSTQLLQGLLGGGDGGGASSASLTRLFSAGLRYLVSKPTVKVNAQVTSRSRDSDTQFRVAQSQALAEAGVVLSKGDKNL